MKRVLPIFFTFFMLTFVFPGKVLAACESTDPKEFHSLRPYPAKPCLNTTDDYAKFCGNNLTLHDTINENYPGNGDCKSNTNGTITCTYNEPIDKTITIDLSIASLPIMGNTEDVTNSSKNSSEKLDDAQKVNNYVSWYLNGVNYRAEYGDTKTDIKSLINFSGPIQKLLPGAILDAQRIKTISNAGNTNHNQMVVCANKAFQIWIPLVGTVGFGKSTPIPCYGGSFKYRLEAWKDKNDLPDYIKNILKEYISKLLEGSGNLAAQLFDKAFIDRWPLKTPPLPWENDPFASPPRQMTSLEYQKYYNEWRGDLCAFLPNPFGGKDLLLCVGIPGVTNNEFADLYSYVPLSGTEDLEGKVAIDSVSSATNPTAAGVTVQNVTFSGQKPATLFFAHMQESDDLANLLQTTFVASGLSLAGSPTDIASGVTCDTVEVRSNKGDNLFAKQIVGQLHYDASFSCDFKPSTDNCMQDCLAKGYVTSYCGSFCSIPGNIKPTTQSCTKDIYISLSTISSTPKVDDIWSRLVAGPASVFKRIFPKTNVVGGIGQIMDIPGSTKITYTGTGVSQSETEIKFPHIGGISEYFLKGIQTMLRPKGFGEPITFAPAANSGPACKSNDTDIDKAINDASAKYGVPAKLLYAIFQMEDGAKFLQNPGGYVCEENKAAGAAGVMQIIPSTYKMLTCADERLENSLACSQPGKLSRCVIHDAFELAARALMFHVGVWPAGSCTPSGKFPNNKEDIYKASCKYYNSFSPDAITIHAAQQFGLPDPENKNYCDVVCYLMGDCPPFP